MEHEIDSSTLDDMVSVAGPAMIATRCYRPDKQESSLQISSDQDTPIISRHAYHIISVVWEWPIDENFGIDNIASTQVTYRFISVHIHSTILQYI